MRLFFKRWFNDKWVLSKASVIIVIGGFFLVTVGQSATTDKPTGKIYNENLKLDVKADSGLTKPGAPESKPAKPESNVELKTISGFTAEAEVIRKGVEHVEKGVVIGLHLLLISLALQVVALSSLRGKFKVMIGLAVLVILFILMHTPCVHWIDKLIGLS